MSTTSVLRCRFNIWPAKERSWKWIIGGSHRTVQTAFSKHVLSPFGWTHAFFQCPADAYNTLLSHVLTNQELTITQALFAFAWEKARPTFRLGLWWLSSFAKVRSLSLNGQYIQYLDEVGATTSRSLQIGCRVRCRESAARSLFTNEEGASQLTRLRYWLASCEP